MLGKELTNVVFLNFWQILFEYPQNKEKDNKEEGKIIHKFVGARNPKYGSGKQIAFSQKFLGDTQNLTKKQKAP